MSLGESLNCMCLPPPPWKGHLLLFGDRGWALAVLSMRVAFSDVCVREGTGRGAAFYVGPLVLVVEHTRLEPHLSDPTQVTACPITGHPAH